MFVSQLCHFKRRLYRNLKIPVFCTLSFLWTATGVSSSKVDFLAKAAARE